MNMVDSFACALLMLCSIAHGQTTKTICQLDAAYVMQKLHLLTSDLLLYGQRFSIYQKARENNETKLWGQLSAQKKLMRSKTKEMAAMKGDLLALRTEVNDMKIVLRTQQETISALRGQLGNRRPEVSFSAYMDKSLETPKTQKIAFRGIRNNVGGAYNPSTGVFTAPVNGTYYFYVGILSLRPGEFAIYSDEKGKKNQIANLITSRKGYDTGVSSVVVHLKKGDKVYVKTSLAREGSSSFYVHHYWSSFSGFLVHNK